jgi:DNA-binding LytR/AlgR family response regulator
MTHVIRAVVAEDQAEYAEALQGCLEATGQVEVVARAGSGLECLRRWEEFTPDLLLLDVQMPDLSGIEVAEIVLMAATPPFIVFVTAHEDFAVRAFELHAADYIVKPISMDALEARIADTVRHVQAGMPAREPAAAEMRGRLKAATSRLESLGPEHPLSVLGRLPVKDYRAGTVRLVPTRDITHARRDGKRVVIVTEEDELPTYYSIDRLEQRLEHEAFVRVSAGALVNVVWIDHMIPLGDGSYDVLLRDRNQTVLSASRPRAQALLRALGV